MTEFKQIVGRGTRINEAYGKFWFTIIDFKKATELFADPDFDGEPVQVYLPGTDGNPVPPESFDEENLTDEIKGSGDDLGQGDWQSDEPEDEGEGGKRIKYVINDVPVRVIAERVQYYGNDGKLITESLKDYTRNSVKKAYSSLDEFLQSWTSAGKKKLIVEELEKQGVFWEALYDEVGKELDPFDLICHVAFDQPPLTRRERVENIRKRDVFTKYGKQARAVLEALLQKYQDEGVTNLDDPHILKIAPFDTMGTPIELLKTFGGRQGFEQAVHELQHALYEGAA
jgi:type I restriction enzyme R subunit